MGKQSEGEYSKEEQSWSGSDTIVCHHQKGENVICSFDDLTNLGTL